MNYEQFSKIYQALKSASADNNLNQGNVIKTIKDQLLSDSDGYKEWEKGNFSLDHVLTTVNDHQPESKHTLLTCACKLADLKVVGLLLKVGADVNVTAGDVNPFTVAIENEYGGSKEDAKAIVDLLIGKVDAHVRVADENVNNTIAKAVERGNLRVFKALKEAGANVNIKVCGMTLLKWAENHQLDPKIKKEDMEKIINTLKAPSEEKKQTDPERAASTSTNNSNQEDEVENTTPSVLAAKKLTKAQRKILDSLTQAILGGNVQAVEKIFNNKENKNDDIQAILSHKGVMGSHKDTILDDAIMCLKDKAEDTEEFRGSVEIIKLIWDKADQKTRDSVCGHAIEIFSCHLEKIDLNNVGVSNLKAIQKVIQEMEEHISVMALDSNLQKAIESLNVDQVQAALENCGTDIEEVLMRKVYLSDGNPDLLTEVKEPVAGTSSETLPNDTVWSKHKGKIALGVTGLCVAGAIAAYMLAYPAVALALTVLVAVILVGAGIDKVLEDPSVEGLPTSKGQRA